METNCHAFYSSLISVSSLACLTSDPAISSPSSSCPRLFLPFPSHLIPTWPKTVWTPQFPASLPQCSAILFSICICGSCWFVLHFRHSKLSFSSTCLPLSCALESIACFTEPLHWWLTEKLCGKLWKIFAGSVKYIQYVVSGLKHEKHQYDPLN